jgi:hypothetical protein
MGTTMLRHIFHFASVLILLVVTALAAWFLTAWAWNSHVYRMKLRLVPEGMGASHILYSAEEAWGFGPGGNETGILVFDMPNSTREALESNGISWLENLPPNSWEGRQGRYRNWEPTPIAETFFWTSRENCGSESRYHNLASFGYACPGIFLYMDKYGFIITYDREVDSMVNEALFSDGAYYSYGGGGLLIVIPVQDRIVFVYNG